MNTTTNTTILTAEQQEVFNRYFLTRGEQNISKTGINLHIAFFQYEVRRETDIVLEIVSNRTVILMWKSFDHLHITIL